jgi:integrase
VQRLALGLGKLPDDALLFPALDGSLRGPRAFSKEWSDVAAGIGIPQATFHSLRHTHASHLIDAGIDVVKISRRLGHASPAMRVYAHLFRARDDKSSKASMRPWPPYWPDRVANGWQRSHLFSGAPR